ncbi:MAG: hypothetical protein ACRCZI_09655 [Cetobacterium sp.]
MSLAQDDIIVVDHTLPDGTVVTNNAALVLETRDGEARLVYVCPRAGGVIERWVPDTALFTDAYPADCADTARARAASMRRMLVRAASAQQATMRPSDPARLLLADLAVDIETVDLNYRHSARDTPRPVTPPDLQARIDKARARTDAAVARFRAAHPAGAGHMVVDESPAARARAAGRLVD